MNRLSLQGGARMALALAVCGALALTGCRAPDTSALEAENRMLEDQLYELQDHCQQLHDELASARRANSSEGRREPTRGSSPAAELVPPTMEGIPELPSRGPGDEPRLRDATPAEPYLRTPEEESEAPPYQTPSAAPQMDSAPGELPPFESAPPEAAQTWRGGSYDDEPGDSEQVVSITLNRRLTGGHDSPHGPGDDGVMVVVEPRTEDGRIVPVDGDVSIGLLDPELPAEQGRIARWDFSRDESAQFYRRTPMGEGLHFKLPWPGDPPQTETLKLWVRLTTPEGRKLLAQRTVRCELPEEATPAAFDAEVDEDHSVESPSAEKHDVEEHIEEVPRPRPRRVTTRPEWSPSRPR